MTSVGGSPEVDPPVVVETGTRRGRVRYRDLGVAWEPNPRGERGVVWEAGKREGGFGLR